MLTILWFISNNLWYNISSSKAVNITSLISTWTWAIILTLPVVKLFPWHWHSLFFNYFINLIGNIRLKTCFLVCGCLQNRHVLNIPKTQKLCGWANGWETCDGSGRHRRRSGQKTGGQRLWQGICGPGSVSGPKERWRAVQRLDEGNLWGQYQATRGLLRLSERMVRHLCIKHPIVLCLSPNCSTQTLHTLSITEWNCTDNKSISLNPCASSWSLT